MNSEMKARILDGMFCVMVGLAVGLLPQACAGCDYNPINPGTGGTAGTGGDYSPTPVVTGGAQSTGGTEGTGGTVDTECSNPVDDCKAAECRLEALNCRRASDGGPRWETPAGTPLADVCRDRESDGDTICPRCIARISTCDDVEACRPHSPGVCP